MKTGPFGLIKWSPTLVSAVVENLIFPRLLHLNLSAEGGCTGSEVRLSERGRETSGWQPAAPQVSITWVTLLSHQWPCHLRRSSVLNFTMNPDRDTCYAIFSVLLETSTSVRICKVIWQYHMNKHHSRFRHKQSVVSPCLSPMWPPVCSCLGNIATHTRFSHVTTAKHFMEMSYHRPTQSRYVKSKENDKFF